MGRRFRPRRRGLTICRLSWWKRGLIVLLVLSVGLFLLAMYVRPVVMEHAENAALWHAERAVNEAASQVLEQYAHLNENMITVSYTEQQVLSSVITDAAAVNTIRTAVGEAVMDRVEELNALTVDIPVGSLVGPDILSGWGPLLRFPLGVSAYVLSTVSSSLEAVGMNQSAYRVMIKVHVTLCVVTPGSRSNVTLDTALPVAETVLLGEVPDTLTEVYGDDQTLLGKIFDYGTVE